MEPVTFVTGNRWKHEEARRLLAGVDVRVARLTLAKPPSDDLREVARARAADAYRQLRHLQHLARLDEQSTQIEPGPVAAQRAAIQRLWQAVFEPKSGS